MYWTGVPIIRGTFGDMQALDEIHKRKVEIIGALTEIGSYLALVFLKPSSIR